MVTYAGRPPTPPPLPERLPCKIPYKHNAPWTRWLFKKEQGAGDYDDGSRDTHRSAPSLQMSGMGQMMSPGPVDDDVSDPTETESKASSGGWSGDHYHAPRPFQSQSSHSGSEPRGESRGSDPGIPAMKRVSFDP